MLAYKKETCPTIECSRDAYVVLVLWAYKKGVQNQDIWDRVGVAQID
jgi:hypothetical protein